MQSSRRSTEDKSNKLEVAFAKMTISMAELKCTNEVVKRNHEASIREEEELVALEGVDDMSLDQANAESHTEHGAVVPRGLDEIHSGEQFTRDCKEMETHYEVGHASEEAIDIEDLLLSTGDELVVGEVQGWE